jgi:methionine aminopeptidase type I
VGLVKTAEEIHALRQAGRMNAKVHEQVSAALQPGVTGVELEQIALRVMKEMGATSSFPEWTDFPSAICVSVNEQVGHGIPSKTPLREGDIVTIDVGLSYGGMHSDAAATYPVGEVDESAQRLMQATKRALYRGIAAARDGARVSDISSAIYLDVKSAGYETVRHAFGHGIGTALHEDPQIANFGPPGRGPGLRAGMVVAIEPVVTAGMRYTRTLDDGWTTVTVDGAFAAHFEHTVLITEAGPEILTRASSDTDPAGDLENCGELALTVRTDKLGPIHVRRMKEADRAAMVDLVHRTMDPILMEAWGRRSQPNELFGDPSAEAWVCALDSAEMVGFVIFVMGASLHVNTLVVSPSCQRTGLGRALMTELEGVARRRQLSAVELWVQENNATAIAFYEKLGFVVVGKPYFRTLHMRKTL